MISNSLKILSIISILIILFIITFFVKKNKILVKYSIIWYFCCLLLVLFVLFPTTLSWITHLFGIKLESNFIFIMVIAVLFVISISLTIIVSEQKEAIKNVIQEVSILKSKSGDKK